MKLMNTVKKISAYTIMTTITYLAIYSLTWIGFLNVAKKEIQIDQSYPMSSLLEINNIAYSFANTFLIPIVLIFIVIIEYKNIKKGLTSFFTKAKIAES